MIYKIFFHFFIIEAETVLRLIIFFCGKGFFSTENIFFAVSGRFCSIFCNGDSLILLSKAIDLKIFYCINKKILKLNMKTIFAVGSVYKKLLLKPLKIKKNSEI